MEEQTGTAWARNSPFQVSHRVWFQITSSMDNTWLGHPMCFIHLIPKASKSRVDAIETFLIIERNQNCIGGWESLEKGIHGVPDIAAMHAPKSCGVPRHGASLSKEYFGWK